MVKQTRQQIKLDKQNDKAYAKLTPIERKIIRLLNAAPGSVTGGEIAKATQLPLMAVPAILKTLVHQGWAERGKPRKAARKAKARRKARR